MDNKAEKKDTPKNLWKKLLDFLSHPAWNGLSCFFAALSIFGIGGLSIGYFIGLFDKLQDLYKWLISPVVVPMYLLAIGILIILAFLITIIHQRLFNRKSNKDLPRHSFEEDSNSLSSLDIEILKQLASNKEEGNYWVSVSSIANNLKLTENYADYYLRQLEDKRYAQHHMIYGTWGIQDLGLDYLIKNNHI